MTANSTTRRNGGRSIFLFLAGALLHGTAAHAVNPPPAQTFYIPFPEDQFLQSLQTITTGFGSQLPVNPIHTYVSVAVFVSGTVLYYDQWENGFDADIANPANLYSASNPGGTQVWGDGNPANGFPPGFPNDVIPAGSVILLNNTVQTATRQSVIDFDGGDKIAASKPIAVTRAAWATGSGTLLATANEVYDTVFFGSEFRSPVGEDIAPGVDDDMFSYTGFFVMAGPKGATVQIDKDANGTFETTVTLAEGESYLIDGGVNVGGRVVADRPIQVELMTGDRGEGFESRTARLMPTSYWTSSATTPVSTPTNSFTAVDGGTYRAGTTVWLYNPGATQLPVNYIRRTGSSTLVTNSLTIPANGYLKQVIPDGTGARFVAPSERPFYAFATVDSTGGTTSHSTNNSNRTWDWGFALVPDGALTAQVLVGLGLGRDPTSATNPNENGAPVWVTPVGNGNTPVTIYVDYDGDPSTGPLTDLNSNKYDVAYSARELERLKIYNTAKGNQTGMYVYVLDETVRLAAAWGTDPVTASPAAPGLDTGTGIPPLPLFFAVKSATLVEDRDGDGFVSPGDVIEYAVTIENIGRTPVPDLRVADRLPDTVSYLADTTLFIDHEFEEEVIPDNEGSGILFPLDGNGRLISDRLLPMKSSWHVTYHTEILPFDQLAGVPTLMNFAMVNGAGATSTNAVETLLHGRIRDFVWYDADRDGLQDPGEPGVAGATVRLLDAAGNPVYDNTGKLIETVTDANGHYELLGVPAGNYRVAFVPPAGYVFTQPNADGLGIDGENNSTPATSDGRTGAFTLLGGATRTTLDAGLQRASAIGDFVWIDANGNGLRDESEPGLNGVTVRLLDAAGNPVLNLSGQPVEAVTANDAFGNPGHYVLDNLYPGSYQVQFVLPGGKAFAAADADGQGVFGTANSDANPATGRTPVFTLGAEERLTSIDAGVLSLLGITKTANTPGPVVPGDIVTYTVVVTNAGTTAQTNVAVTDALPEGTAFVPGSLHAAMSRAAAGVSTTVVYNASDTFLVPPGVTRVTVEAWGGGGGGGIDDVLDGSRPGGGGGAYARSVLDVTPGGTFPVVVGAGGARGVAGGTSSFGNDLVKAAGGRSNLFGGNGGAGGAVEDSFGNVVCFAGGRGGNNGGLNTSGGGGGGSARSTGNGGNGGDGNLLVGGKGGKGGSGTGKGGDGGDLLDLLWSGWPGTAPGGGGGGRSFLGGVSGSGADGRVAVTYEQPVTVVYNEGGTFIVPSGVTRVTVEAWGGGGGGGNASLVLLGSSPGGGGGAYARSVLNVTPGTAFTVTVGNGGGVGSAGGNSSFGGNQVVAVGGGSNASGGTGGAGGAASSCIGDARWSGGRGGNNGGLNTSGGGGGGSAFPTADGGDGTRGGLLSGGAGGTGGLGTGAGGAGGDLLGLLLPAQEGSAPGGGGGGRSALLGGSSGSGAKGRVIVSYEQPPTVVYNNTQIYNANGTFVVPPGVSSVMVEAWGGGGGGGSGSDRAPGGGGGAYARSVLNVTPGSSFAVVVGAGGVAGTAGGSSSFGNNVVVAVGGGSTTGTSAGSGGTAAASTGLTCYTGGSGGARGSSSNNTGGGGGSSALATGDGYGGSQGSSSGGAGGNTGNEGAGGRGGNNNSGSAGSGLPGIAPGGGGGGRGNSGTSSGAGAVGRVIVTYAQDLEGTTGTPSDLAAGWTLPPGAALTLTYQVTVSGPPAQVTDVRNTAFVTSGDYPAPLPASVNIPMDAASLGTVGSRVWHDLDGDGLQGAGEPGLTNVTVQLYRMVPNGQGGVATNLVAETTTDNGGNYTFGRLPPGDYIVRAVPPAGHTSAPANVGDDRAVDNDGDADGWSGPVAAAAGEMRNDIGFGLYQPTMVKGYVFKDNNGNLLRDTGDSSITNVLVRLMYNGMVIASTTTDANGYYHFTGVPAGTVSVLVSRAGATLIDVPNTGDERRNRAVEDAPNGDENAVIVYMVYSGYGVLAEQPAETLNFGFATYPLSTSIAIGLHAAAGGVMIDIWTVDESGYGDIVVFAWIGNAWIEVGRVPSRQVLGEGSNRYTVAAEGLAAGGAYFLKVIDEAGHVHFSPAPVAVDALRVEAVRLELQTLTMSFNTTPGRSYVVEVSTDLAIWSREVVSAPTAAGWSAYGNEPFTAGPGERTEVRVPVNGRPRAFFRVRQAE
jgi:uncharacterized repeat protein (TIGR01451 family)